MRARTISVLVTLIAGTVLAFPAPAMAQEAYLPDPASAPFGCIDSDPNDPSNGPYTVCTNDNTNRTRSDAVVVDELTRLVNRTQFGDTIKISMFQWWYRQCDPEHPQESSSFDYSHLKALTHAVISAWQNRNVDVEVMIQNVSNPLFNNRLQTQTSCGTQLLEFGDQQPFDELKAALPADKLHVCVRQANKDWETPIDEQNDGAKIYDCLDGGNKYAINHNKFFLLEIGGFKHVVLTSANLTPAAHTSYNNLIHVRWDASLYNFMLGYWNRLKANSWNGWDGPSDRHQCGDGCATHGYVFPHTPYNDLFAQAVLNNVTACPDPENRKIWISMSGVTEPRLSANVNQLLNRIRELANMGCAVKFLVDDHVTDDNQQTYAQNPGNVSNVDKMLRDAGATVVQVEHLHHKFAIIDAEMNGVPTREVWTGSHNISYASAWRDGEAAIVLGNDQIVQAYISHFKCVWNRNFYELNGNNDMGGIGFVGDNDDDLVAGPPAPC